jgi:hypothetical protein
MSLAVEVVRAGRRCDFSTMGEYEQSPKGADESEDGVQE